MSTTDGAIDQNLFYDLKWIFNCQLPKTNMQMKHLSSTKFYLSLSAQIRQHDRYSKIQYCKNINSTLILSQIWICKKSPINDLKVNELSIKVA